MSAHKLLSPAHNPPIAKVYHKLSKKVKTQFTLVRIIQFTDFLIQKRKIVRKSSKKAQ